MKTEWHKSKFPYPSRTRAGNLIFDAMCLLSDAQEELKKKNPELVEDINRAKAILVEVFRKIERKE